MLNYTHVEETLKDDPLALAVFRALHNHPDGISRNDLVKTIYIDADGGPKTQSARDRAVRRAIAGLRNFGVVVLSTSGKSGYRLASINDVDQVREFVREQFAAAKARMKAAASVRRAYGLKDNLEFPDGLLAEAMA